MIVQACVKYCTCFSTRRSVSWTIQLNSVPNCLCEPVATHSFRIILEALQCSYSEPPLVSLRQQAVQLYFCPHNSRAEWPSVSGAFSSRFLPVAGLMFLSKRNLKFCLSWRDTLLVAQLVEALRYKPDGRGFDSRWWHCNFSLKYSFRPHCGSGVDSASNRNEYR